MKQKNRLEQFIKDNNLVMAELSMSHLKGEGEIKWLSKSKGDITKLLKECKPPKWFTRKNNK